MFNSNEVLFPRDSLHLIFLVVTGDVILLQVQVAGIARLGRALSRPSVTANPGTVRSGPARARPGRSTGGCRGPALAGQVWHGDDRHDPRITDSVTTHNCRLRLKAEHADLTYVAVTVADPDILQVVRWLSLGGAQASLRNEGPAKRALSSYKFL